MSQHAPITLFPALFDNYGFIVRDQKNDLTACFDTPDADAIIAQCEALGVKLTHIFNTHHHPDHVGGNQALKEKYDAIIIGPADDAKRIPLMDHGMSDGDVFKFGQYDIKMLSTPGHTIGHCIYYIPALSSAFVGDVIFALGCGRLFEGTPQQMYDSFRKIEALPDDTLLYCAHEYTLSNAKFARSIAPDDIALGDYIKTVQSLRAEGTPTVPTSVAAEKALNPFMRAKSAKEFGEIRAAKDNF